MGGSKQPADSPFLSPPPLTLALPQAAARSQATSIRMDNTYFVKMCRETGLLDYAFTRTVSSSQVRASNLALVTLQHSSAVAPTNGSQRRRWMHGSEVFHDM